MVTKAPIQKASGPRNAAVTAVTPAGASEGGTSDDAAAAKDVAMLKIKEFVDRVIVTSGVTNRKNVRQVVDATFGELVKALQAGEGPNLPKLGRLRVANQREDEGGLHMTLKLRRPSVKAGSESDDKDALAVVGEDS